MVNVDLDGSIVGFVPDQFGNEDHYDDLVSDRNVHGVIYDGHREFLADLEANIADVEYLVLESGPEAMDVLASVSETARRIPRLFVHDGAQSANAAIDAGATMLLDQRNITRLEARIESMYVGNNVDTDQIVRASNPLGNVHFSAYRTLMERFDDLIYVQDRHARFIRVNRGKAEFHDLEPRHFRGRTEFYTFHPKTALEIYQDNYDVMEGYGELKNKPEWIEGADDEKRHVTASKHPIENEDGVVIGFIGISRDITRLTKQQVLMERLKDVIKHVYEIYDHNFRNRSQALSLVTSQIDKGLEPCQEVESILGAIDGRVANGGTKGDVESDDSSDEPRSIHSVINSHWESEPPDPEVATIESILTAVMNARRAQTTATSHLSRASTIGDELLENMESLIDEFSDLVAVVNISQGLTDVSVDAVAIAMLNHPVDTGNVTVEADPQKTEAIFKIINDELPGNDTVTIRSSPNGFLVELPTSVEVPELEKRFEDQDLKTTPKPMLKVRILARIQGWGVTTEETGDGRTVLRFDVNDWKRAAGAGM